MKFYWVKVISADSQFVYQSGVAVGVGRLHDFLPLVERGVRQSRFRVAVLSVSTDHHHTCGCLPLIISADDSGYLCRHAFFSPVTSLQKIHLRHFSDLEVEILRGDLPDAMPPIIQ